MKSKDEDLKALGRETKAVQDSLNQVWEYIMGKQEKKQGIADFGEMTVVMRLYGASRYIGSRPYGPTATEQRLYQQATEATTEAINRTNAFYKNVWPAYREKVENTDFKWFREYEPLEIK